MTRPPQAQTLIVATLGPASASYNTIRAMFEAGADIFRINFSHGNDAEHREKADILRRIERKSGESVEMLGDLQGPKLRVGTFENGKIALTKGAAIRFDSNPAAGNESRVFLPHPEIIGAVSAGNEILLDDGKVGLRVTATGPGYFDTEVMYGAELGDHKGIGVSGASLPFRVPTEKDCRDIRAGLAMGLRHFVQSFLQGTDDIKAFEAEIETAKKELNITDPVDVTIKIETWAALANFEDILKSGHRLMLGRGDLGMAIPHAMVPLAQEYITDRCREEGVELIIATHMMESMGHSPVPTRAEDSDVARAVMSHVYAVMLSAETSTGEFPVEAVTAMDDVCRLTEAWRGPKTALAPRIRHDFLAAVFGAGTGPQNAPKAPQPPLIA